MAHCVSPHVPKLHITLFIINARVLLWPLAHVIFVFIYQYLDHSHISHPYGTIT